MSGEFSPVHEDTQVSVPIEVDKDSEKNPMADSLEEKQYKKETVKLEFMQDDYGDRSGTQLNKSTYRMDPAHAGLSATGKNSSG